MATSSSLPSVREPIADPNGYIGAVWYRLLARLERLIDGALKNPGSGLSIDSSGAFEISAGGVTSAMLQDSLVLRLPKLASYTVAGVPSAATQGAGTLIYVSNESGGAVVAFSDATNWRRLTDRAIIS